MIPYGRQTIDAEDEAAVLAALRSPFLTQGPRVEAFEAEIAAYVGAKHCVAVANATLGLQLAYAALELGAGEGITSPITFIATASAMEQAGLTPVFADIDPETVNLAPRALDVAIGPQTRLVAPVHFAGLPCDMAAIADIARARGLKIVEDAAHAIGSDYADGGRIGSCRHSDMTVFSFHPVKTMTTGEGGAITTNDPELHARLVALRSHGIVRDPTRMARHDGPWFHEQQTLGLNARMTDLQTALGSSQLRKLDGFVTRRRAIMETYRAAFADLEWLGLPPDAGAQRVGWHLFAVRLDFAALGRDRTAVMAELAGAGVGSQVHYIPVHTQPWRRRQRRQGPFPHAEAWYDQCLSLPLFPAMTDAEVEQVIAAVRALRP
ncbi:UDP-4-amino-4,6-dideoxy-N-acetyl-beta-L-altrosamine transaminase [Brevundimonas sp.]|uniref:UDP-4-amino-4, 6-dideoxy-N-acetyl-beta-L-altrosamine transaminase n=1 Tax=Brevundimonas sp. TaxID=1871086 RepID=UPI0035B43E0B